MTETDATKRPLSMPEKFIPYLDKYRIYRMFKDMLSDLIITLPRDHLKHMRMFLHLHLNSTKDTDRVMMLISPQLNIGPGQGFNMVGAPSVYRVLLIGPPGSGKKTQAKLLARHFGLVFLNYRDLYAEAKVRSDEVGKKLRAFGPSVEIKAKIVCRRLMEKDCIDHGWVLIGFPNSGVEFELMDQMPTPPNRIIILNADSETCKQRLLTSVDWCSGKSVPVGSGSRSRPLPKTEEDIDNELEQYLESVAELRAAAGITATEIDSNHLNIEEVQTKVQTALIMAPAFDIITSGKHLLNVRAD